MVKEKFKEDSEALGKLLGKNPPWIEKLKDKVRDQTGSDFCIRIAERAAQIAEDPSKMTPAEDSELTMISKQMVERGIDKTFLEAMRAARSEKTFTLPKGSSKTVNLVKNPGPLTPKTMPGTRVKIRDIDISIPPGSTKKIEDHEIMASGFKPDMSGLAEFKSYLPKDYDALMDMGSLAWILHRRLENPKRIFVDRLFGIRADQLIVDDAESKPLEPEPLPQSKNGIMVHLPEESTERVYFFDPIESEILSVFYKNIKNKNMLNMGKLYVSKEACEFYEVKNPSAILEVKKWQLAYDREFQEKKGDIAWGVIGGFFLKQKESKKKKKEYIVSPTTITTSDGALVIGNLTFSTFEKAVRCLEKFGEQTIKEALCFYETN